MFPAAFFDGFDELLPAEQRPVTAATGQQPRVPAMFHGAAAVEDRTTKASPENFGAVGAVTRE